MLTPAERKEKKMAQLVGEAAPDTLVAIYKVEPLKRTQILTDHLDLNHTQNMELSNHNFKSCRDPSRHSTTGRRAFNDANEAQSTSLI